MSKSKLVPSILVGAAVGAVVSLFDKNTREHTIQTASKLKKTISYYAENREDLQSLIDTKVEQVQALYSSAEQSIQSLLNKDDTASSLPKTVTALLTETKDVFSQSDQQ